MRVLVFVFGLRLAADGECLWQVKASKLFNNSNWLIPQLFYDSPETTEVANFQNRFAVMDSGNMKALICNPTPFEKCI